MVSAYELKYDTVFNYKDMFLFQAKAVGYMIYD